MERDDLMIYKGYFFLVGIGRYLVVGRNEMYKTVTK